MSETFRAVYLACHGETAWTVTGQHTGRTDLAPTEPGERNTQRLGERLGGLRAKVFTSPSRRAMRICELACFGSVAQIDGDLVEWDYGTYEGRLKVDILKEPPDWQLFRDGCPGGESPRQVAARADRVVSRVRTVTGDVLVFSSGHFLRVLATRSISKTHHVFTSNRQEAAYVHASGTSLRATAFGKIDGKIAGCLKERYK